MTVRSVSSVNTSKRLSQAGLTLLELLVSMGLGLLLLIGMGTIYLGSKQTYRMQESNARLQETGRYALEIIGRSIRQAGFTDMTTKTQFTGTPIQGTNGASTNPDTLTVQYDWMSGDSACDGDTTRADGTPALPGDQIQDYFNLDAATFQLRCDGVIAPPVLGVPGAGIAIVDGVEDFQVLYGIDTDTDQSANFYTASPANWAQVVSARVCVLVRSANQGLTDTNQRYLNCAGALITAADRRLRRTFVATFNLRNRVNLQP